MERGVGLFTSSDSELIAQLLAAIPSVRAVFMHVHVASHRASQVRVIHVVRIGRGAICHLGLVHLSVHDDL